MLTIAHYQKSKIWFQLVIGIFILTFLFFITFWSYRGQFVNRITYSPRAFYLIPGLVVAWFCGFMTSVTIGLKIKQLILNNGRAVWIDHGKVVFLRNWYVSVSCDEITEISYGEIPTSSFTKAEAVIFSLRGDRQERLSTSSLFEPRDTIIDNLNTALGLRFSEGDN